MTEIHIYQLDLLPKGEIIENYSNYKDIFTGWSKHHNEITGAINIINNVDGKKCPGWLEHGHLKCNKCFCVFNSSKHINVWTPVCVWHGTTESFKKLFKNTLEYHAGHLNEYKCGFRPSAANHALQYNDIDLTFSGLAHTDNNIHNGHHGNALKEKSH